MGSKNIATIILLKFAFIIVFSNIHNGMTLRYFHVCKRNR